jgi:CspA family cold shock protein
VAGPIPSAGAHHGRVASFDPARGLGEVVDDDGTPFPFHATAVADGSRTIAVGTAVSFVVAPGHRGRYEARSLAPAGPRSHQRPA